MAPHGPARAGRRGRTEPLDEIRLRLVGEGADPIGAGVVERAVELHEGGLERAPRWGAVSDRLTTLVLIMRDGIEAFTEILFGRVCLFGALSGDIDQGLGGGHRLVIASAPVAPPGLLQRGLAFCELPFGVVACPKDVGKLAAVLLPFRDSVGGDGGI